MLTYADFHFSSRMSTESEIDGDEFNSSLGCSLAKKRKRADSDFAEVETMVVEQGSDSPTSPAAADSGPIVRDRNYYLEDGSCILLVQDTLFNVCALLHMSLTCQLTSATGSQNHVVQRRLVLQHHVLSSTR